MAGTSLQGRCVVVTRTRSQAAALVRPLEQAGATVMEFPTIRIEPLPDSEPLREAIGKLSSYDWLIFTSANGVACFFAALQRLSPDARVPHALQVAAIGPATAEALTKHGQTADVIPSVYQAEGLLDSLARKIPAASKVLIPRASQARDLLPRQLTDRGVRVDVLPIYRSVRPDLDVRPLRQALQERRVDALTFTSSSTVRHFVECFETGEAVGLLRDAGVVIACIGPITAQTARESGLRVNVLPERSTAAALASALIRSLSR